MIEQIKSHKFSLADIVKENLIFNIPIYQRLYVWDNDVIRVFMTDLKNAFLESKQKDYFIGSIVYVKNDKDNCYDLIDGQQRNTTLWLISNVLGFELDNFAFADKHHLRLKFSIRHHVTEYFNCLRNKDYKNDFPDFKDDDDLINISKAFIQIKSFVDNNENGIPNKEDFAAYIFNRVKLICTEVPKNTDLTKLFEVINARGVQLRQDEILKAKLLSIINSDKNYKESVGNLSKLWEACADMNGYVAFNLKNQLDDNITWGALLKAEEDDDENRDLIVKKFNNKFFDRFIQNSKYKNHDGNISYNLVTLIENEQDVVIKSSNNDTNNDSTKSSIITFPMLLLHALRIFLYEKGFRDIPFFSEKKLIEIFETSLLNDHNNKRRRNLSTIVLEFIKCLWDVKLIFDDKVVKWISSGKEKELLQVKLYFTRTSNGAETPKLDTLENNSFTALQAMLYHSQEMITQFWLTPYLNYHYQNPRHNTVKSFEYLRKLDNQLLSSNFIDGDLKERTLKLMTDFELDEANEFNVNRFSVTSTNELGVQFPHYWFYKLEYVLFYEFLKNEKFLSDFHAKNNDSTVHRIINKDQKLLWKNYRITAKNSVEHISPQNPEVEKDKLCTSMLNHFGNLALVTRSINSSYSNLSFDRKKAAFIDSKRNNRMDALKLDVIYSNWDESSWNDETAEQHQNDMKLILENYFNENI